MKTDILKLFLQIASFAAFTEHAEHVRKLKESVERNEVKFRQIVRVLRFKFDQQDAEALAQEILTLILCRPQNNAEIALLLGTSLDMASTLAAQIDSVRTKKPFDPFDL